MTTNPKLTGVSYHRNGCHGAGFFAVTFDWRQGRITHHMVATVFREEDGTDHGRIAILDATMASHGDVRFGQNSWRYEDFDMEIRTWVRDYDIVSGAHPLLAGHPGRAPAHA